MSRKKQSETRWLPKIMGRIAIVATLIVCAVSVVSTQSSIAEKKTELEQIQSQIDTLTAENEDLTQLLESDDIDSYMEKIAREEYNYAYPDEYRFYDTSRN